MSRVQRGIEREQLERQARLTAAFVDAAIATSAALDAVLAAVYRRAPDSFAHMHRVGVLAVRIGEELGLMPAALDDVERAAWLHDIGKLVVEDEPNGDRDEVTARQAAQTVAAAEIATAVPFLRPAARLVLTSRECVDGSGEPLGLRGEAIPIGARILHVADSSDALAMLCATMSVPLDVVGVELVKHAGSRFDPDVVAACLRCSDRAAPLPPTRGGVPCS